MSAGDPAAEDEHEHKYLLSPAEAEAFLERAAHGLRLEVHDRARPVAYTRTTYLDSDDLEYFSSSDGPRPRRMRIREYAAARGLDEEAVMTGLCFLEFKQNVGSLRTKLRVAAPRGAIPHLLLSGDLAHLGAARNDADRQALELIRAELRAKRPRPQVVTWYRRVSFSGEGGAVRVTLDLGLAFLWPTTTPGCLVAVRGDDVIEHGPSRVLEVKYRGRTPRWLAESLAPLTETVGFSKFRAAMLAVAGRRRLEPGTPPHTTP